MSEVRCMLQMSKMQCRQSRSVGNSCKQNVTVSFEVKVSFALAGKVSFRQVIETRGKLEVLH